METNNTRDGEGTAASFEKPARRYGLLAGFGALALVAGLAGGYALSGGDETALAFETTTTTTASADDSEEETSEQTSGTDAEPFGVDFPENNGEGSDPESPAQADNDGEDPSPEPEPETEPDPDPAQLAVDDAVDVGVEGEGAFTIHNLGDEDLDMYSVTAPATVSFNDIPATIGGGDSAIVEITVDTSGFAVGPYDLEIEVKSSAGSETVKVTGNRLAVIVLPPPSPDIDVQDQVVVPHLMAVAPIKIWNNEDESVEVTLEFLHPRLTLPAEATLAPGVNVIIGTIAPYGIHAQTAMGPELRGQLVARFGRGDCAQVRPVDHRMGVRGGRARPVPFSRCRADLEIRPRSRACGRGNARPATFRSGQIEPMIDEWIRTR